MIKKIISLFTILTILACGILPTSAKAFGTYYGFEDAEGTYISNRSSTRNDLRDAGNNACMVMYNITPEISSEQASNGDKSMKFVPSSGGENNQIYVRTFDLNASQAGQTVTLSFDLYAESSAPDLDIYVYDTTDGQLAKYAFTSTVGEFTTFEKSFAIPESNKNGIKEIMIKKFTKDAVYYMDNFSCTVEVEDSDLSFDGVATYKDVDGTLEADGLGSISAGETYALKIGSVTNISTTANYGVMQMIAVYDDGLLVDLDVARVDIPAGQTVNGETVSVKVPETAVKPGVKTYILNAESLEPYVFSSTENPANLVGGGSMEKRSMVYSLYNGSEAVSYTTEEAYTGQYSMKIVPSGAYPGIRTTSLDVKEDKVYNYSLSVKPSASMVADSSKRYVRLDMYVFYNRYNSAGTYVDTITVKLGESPTPVAPGWFKMSKNYTISEPDYSIGGVQFGFYMHHDGAYYDTYYIDDICVTPGESEESTSYTGVMPFDDAKIEELAAIAADYSQYKNYEQTTSLYEGDAPVINLDGYEPDMSRVAAALKKARDLQAKADRGEALTADDKIVVGSIGGSITAGAGSSEDKYSYNARIGQWWQKTFPDVPVECINAGIGGTPSYLGVHRAWYDILKYSPDFIVIEFAVNDGNGIGGLASIEALVRECVNLDADRDGTVDKYPGVMLLFNTRESGSSSQNYHAIAAQRYSLPMCSYRNAVYPEIYADKSLWRNLYADQIHPNNQGHRLLAEFVTYQLEQVLADLDNITINAKPTDKGTTLASEKYYNGNILVPINTTPKSMTGFEVHTQNYHDWNRLYGFEGINQYGKQGINSTWRVKDVAGAIEFEVTATDIAIVYEAWHESAKVYVDGVDCGTIDSAAATNSANYFTAAENLEKKVHTVRIENVDNGDFRLMGILTSDNSK